MMQESSPIVYWALFLEGKGKGLFARRYVSLGVKRKRPDRTAVSPLYHIEAGGADQGFESREEARAFFSEMGLTCYPRKAYEPKNLLETWV